MKEKIVIVGICMILIIPIVSSEKDSTHQSFQKLINNNKHYTLDDPPGWANGRFNGTWGLSVAGLPAVELGWIEGYYYAVGIFGRIQGEFAEWKNDVATAYIEGTIILFNMIGVVGDINDTENSTFYMGLGAPNENGEFYYRINLIVGPSWYIQGTWEEI